MCESDNPFAHLIQSVHPSESSLGLQNMSEASKKTSPTSHLKGKGHRAGEVHYWCIYMTEFTLSPVLTHFVKVMDVM